MFLVVPQVPQGSLFCGSVDRFIKFKELSLSPHLGFVCCHVAVKLLRLVVRRAVSGEPHVERLVPPLAGGGAHREDLNVLRFSVQEFSQRSTQTGESTLLSTKELLHCQIWKERRELALWNMT